MSVETCLALFLLGWLLGAVLLICVILLPREGTHADSGGPRQ